MRRYVAVVACACSLMPFLSLNQVHDRKDHDPDDVHEMPVQACDLDGHRVRRTKFAAQRLHPVRQQPDHTDGHVGAVSSRQHVERRAEQVCREA